jgi:hypothetical protein
MEISSDARPSVVMPTAQAAIARKPKKNKSYLGQATSLLKPKNLAKPFRSVYNYYYPSTAAKKTSKQQDTVF